MKKGDGTVAEVAGPGRLCEILTSSLAARERVEILRRSCDAVVAEKSDEEVRDLRTR